MKEITPSKGIDSPRTRILFITWDGPQVNYVESLFLPIFQALQDFGYHFDILQFRWGSPALAEPIRRQCRAAGVGYRAVYTMRRLGGLGAFLSALWGARHIKRSVRELNPDVLMPRSLMASLSALVAGGSRLRPILFDADGLLADERVEFAGLSPSGAVYRILRDIEAQMVRSASAVIVRTDAAAEVLVGRAGPPVSRERMHKVTNGRDPALFTPFDATARTRVREELGIATTAPLIIYAGSVGSQYRLDRVAALAREIRTLRPDSHLLILSGSPAEAKHELLRAAPELESSMLVMRVEPSHVPRFLAAADVGVAYRTRSFSMSGVAPVKISEYLLCGLPIVGTPGIGDTAPALEAGVFFDGEGEPAAAARWLVDTVLPNRETFRDRARDIGLEYFSSAASVDGYLSALRALDIG